MSNAIDKYLEYRLSIQDKESPENIAEKKAQFEIALQDCNPFENDERGKSLVEYVIYSEEMDILTKILDKIGKYQQLNTETLRLLKAAITIKSDKVLKLLSNYGIDVDQVEFNGFGRTQLAAYSDMVNLDACIFLLRNGANITRINTFHNPQNVFDYAFKRKPNVNENIQAFNRKKIQLINFLSLWACFVDYNPDLSNINFAEIDPEIRKNVFLIGAKLNGYELHLQRTLEFNNAYATIDALLDKANTDPQFNFKDLYLALKHCVDAGNNNSELMNIFENFKKTWLQKSGDNIVLFTLFYHPQGIDNLPPEFKTQAKQQQEELEINTPNNLLSNQQKM